MDIRAHDHSVITCLQLTEDYIISGSDDNTLRVFNAETGDLVHVLSGHDGGVWSSAVRVLSVELQHIKLAGERKARAGDQWQHR